MRIEAFSFGLLPDQFYDLDYDDYLLIRKGFEQKVKTQSMLIRTHAALVCEAFVGQGKGVRFVMDGWPLEERKQITQEQIAEVLKKKRERDALRRMNNG